MFNKCPDFDLAPLKNFDPKIFQNYNDSNKNLKNLDGFIITLGLIFNDLKGLFWWNGQLMKGKPENFNEITGYVGQWSGMNIQINRLCLGLLAELLNTINKNEDLLHQPVFIKTIKNLKNKTRSNWNDLVLAAKNKNSEIKKDRELYSLIQEVRSNGVFHYENIGEIHKGFVTYFAGEFPTENQDFYKNAYMSLGKSMFETRFYFSDAAIDGYGKMKAKNFRKKHGEVDISRFTNNLLDNINNAIRFLIDEYIKIRIKE